MLSLVFLIFFPFLTSVNSFGEFTKADIRGAESICQKLENLEEEKGQTCSYYSDFDEVKSTTKLSNDLDEHLALSEIKRQVLAMANAQIINSFKVLDRLGVEKKSLVLSRKMDELKVKGYSFPKGSGKEDQLVSDQYLIAALRYHEHKYTLANYPMDKSKKEEMAHRLKLLELRYPLIANFNFKALKDYASHSFGISGMPKIEGSEEAAILDSYLLNDIPRNLKDVDGLGIIPKSNTAKNLEALIKNQDESKIKKIRDVLKEELQTSLTLQISPLENINKFDACQIVNIHSRITLEAINSSANPEKLLGKYCSCQKDNSIIDEDIVMGLEMSSLGGLGLCITPTVVGQVLGCPTAMIAGLGATGASTINFIGYMRDYSKIKQSKGLTSVLEMGEFNKEELSFIEEKEMDSLKNIGLSRLIGVVGFSVGHIGMKGLLKVYEKSNVSTSFSKLIKSKRENFEKKMDALPKSEQTQAFVILEKLDDDVREFFIERPEVFLKNLKGGGVRCAI